MHLVIRSMKEKKEQLLATGIDPDCQVSWLPESAKPGDWPVADAYIDLLFEESGSCFPENINPDTVIIIHAVISTLPKTQNRFVRINAWPGFLEKPIWEAAGNKDRQPAAEKVVSLLHHEIQWCPDQPGLISARVISQIINEAYLALEEGVSSKQDIDTAMQTGTNYPLGPFAWAKLVQPKNWVRLINTLGADNPRYQTAPLLLKEANDE